MENIFANGIKGGMKSIKYWWIMLIVGVIIFAAGIMTFVMPIVSYIGMTLLFGLLILAAGIAQIIIAASSSHPITGRGWMMAGGIVEVILGLILALNSAFAATVLPFFLGFWLLFRGFSMLGFGGDMSALKMPGSGWTIFTAVLLMICAVFILIQPFYFGVQAVIIWVGISLLFAGSSLAIFSLQLRNLHRH